MTSSNESSANLSSCSEDGIAITNPIGALNELCNLNRSPQPSYMLVHSEGPSHAMTFYMGCVLNGKVDFGQGKSKKAAKNKAAQRMLKRLNHHKLVARSWQREVTDIPVGFIHRVLEANDEAPESEAGLSTKNTLPTWEDRYKQVATSIPRQEYTQFYAEAPF